MAHIKLHDVSLSYPIMGETGLTLKSSLKSATTGGTIRKSDSKSSSGYEVVALDGISITIESGERIGIIGHNGAGKTTLLKLIAGIYSASSGNFERDGTVGTVINPGNGLQMNITGYENIENVGLLSGLTIKEIRSLLPEIEEFTQLGPFLSLPVETYSTGMMARLAFAVATALSPEILVIDENLSTGDQAFIEQAKKRMDAMIERSEILILASHSLTLLPDFVDRLLLLEGGKIKMDGSVDEVIACYNEVTESE